MPWVVRDVECDTVHTVSSKRFVWLSSTCVHSAHATVVRRVFHATVLRRATPEETLSLNVIVRSSAERHNFGRGGPLGISALADERHSESFFALIIEGQFFTLVRTRVYLAMRIM